ncbi:MAG: pentapeptide repeat-containing protein [Rhodospirillales bacterium]|nr:pentapeptide repeat-containing protein [Rhodospirillales bacterium]
MRGLVIALLATFTIIAAGAGLAWTNWEWLRSGAREAGPNSATPNVVGLLIGGALAFFFAVWRSWSAERQTATARQQAAIARRNLLRERYQAAARMLGGSALAARLGGVYALRDLGADYPEQYHMPAMRLLCAFARHPTDVPESGVFNLMTPPGARMKIAVTRHLREDVQAVMEVIRDRSDAQIKLEEESGFRLDLRGADLAGARLANAQLAEAHLSRTRLSRANLVDADLWHADLSCPPNHVTHYRTDLGGADLCGANLRHANLSGSNLQGDFRGRTCSKPICPTRRFSSRPS